jgi:diguanylate cyclase (GGDEF)-like protein
VIRRLLFILACLLVATPGVAQVQVAVLDEAAGDPLPALVLEGGFDARFRAMPARFALPPSTTPRWVRVIPPGDARGERVLALARLPTRSVQAFLPDARGGYRQETQSFFRPDPEQFSPSAYAFFLDRPAPLAPPRPIYLRILANGRLYIDVDVQPRPEFHAGERRFGAMIVAGFTTLAVMLLFNAIFFAVLRERLYALYVAFVGAQMLWVLFATGVVFVLPGGSSAAADLPGRTSGVMIALSQALLLLFVRAYLRLRRTSPGLDRILSWVGLAFFALAALFLWPGDAGQVLIGRLASLLFSIISPALLLSLAWLAWRRVPNAGLMLLAWLPLGVMTMIRTAVSWGWIAPSTWTIYAPLQAVAFESLVLSVGLALRLRTLREERDEARQRAEIDGLTGALTRSGGETRLQSMVADARADGAWLALAFVDLDNLKQVNDRYRHDAGDAALRLFADRVGTMLPSDAALARWGGDEFLLLLPHQDADAAAALCDAIAARLREAPLVHREHRIELRASIGVAAARGADVDLGALLAQADAALYRAKRGGRDQVAGA